MANVGASPVAQQQRIHLIYLAPLRKCSSILFSALSIADSKAKGGSGDFTLQHFEDLPSCVLPLT